LPYHLLEVLQIQDEKIEYYLLLMVLLVFVVLDDWLEIVLGGKDHLQLQVEIEHPSLLSPSFVSSRHDAEDQLQLTVADLRDDELYGVSS